VSEAWHGFVFHLGACICQNIKDPSPGSRYGGGEPVGASSEAETRSRGHLVPERGRAWLEGASSHRARQNSVGVGLCPSSEAESRPRVAGADCAGGPLGPLGLCLGMFYVAEFVYVLLFAKESGFSLVISGTPMAVPNSSPRAYVVISVGSHRGWRLLMGHSSLLDDVLFRGGALAHSRV
jgi:hypothetical protein